MPSVHNLQAAMEVMIASSVMALAKAEELKIEESMSEGGSLEKWKRGGIIGAAAVTGGALMAITGGMDSYNPFESLGKFI